MKELNKIYIKGQNERVRKKGYKRPNRKGQIKKI